MRRWGGRAGGTPIRGAFQVGGESILSGVPPAVWAERSRRMRPSQRKAAPHPSTALRFTPLRSGCSADLAPTSKRARIRHAVRVVSPWCTVQPSDQAGSTAGFQGGAHGAGPHGPPARPLQPQLRRYLGPGRAGQVPRGRHVRRAAPDLLPGLPRPGRTLDLACIRNLCDLERDQRSPLRLHHRQHTIEAAGAASPTSASPRPSSA